MKPWLKLGSVAATLVFLAACSSGIQQTDLELGDETPELSTQGTSVSHEVPNSESDAEEVNRSAYTTSPVLELGYKVDGTPQTTGIRFLGVNVPKGARITSAFIRFTAVTDKSGMSSLTIVGQDDRSGGPFAAITNNITSRIKTSAKSTWQPGSWLDGQRYNSSSIASIAQEIVNRSDWQQGAAMVFIISGTGSRKAQSYDASSALAPKLYVTYETVTPPPGKRFKADLKMKVDPNFSEARLKAYDPEAYSNYLKVLNASTSGLESTASEGTSRAMSRDVNYNTTTLLAALRVTGDVRLLDKVARIMTAAKNSLTTTTVNGGSYRTWRNWEGNELDETLLHGFVARVAYAFQLNRSVKAEYANQADFWLNYLQDDFEPKWRAEDSSYGSTIVDKFLMHSYTGMTAYHVYMYKLTGNTTYLNIANERAGVIKRAFKVYNNAFVWPHGVNEFRGSKPIWAYQPGVYVGETTSNIYDLALEGFTPFDNTAFMPKYSNGIRDHLLNAQHPVSSSQSYVFSSDIGPDSCPAGTTQCPGVTKSFSDPVFGTVTYVAPAGYENGGLYRFLGRPYAMVGVWDSTGSIIQKARNYQKYNTSAFDLPAAIVLNNLYKKGGFALGQ